MKPLETHNLGDLFEFEVNGRTVKATVLAKVYFDECYSIDDLETFETDTERQAFIHKLDRGDLTPCIIVVEAFALNLEGSDSLGAVIVSKPEDVTQTIEDHGMIQQAIDALKSSVLSQIETLKPYIAT